MSGASSSLQSCSSTTIERREIGRRVVVDDELAGQPLNEIGGRGEDLRGPGEDLRAVLLQPQDLRPDRLARSAHCRSARGALLADRGGRAPRSPWPRARRRRRAPRSSAARRPRRPAACTGRWRWRRPRGSRRAPPATREAASWQMKVKSSHQSCFGRCSAQPGCGTSILCGFAAVATILPAAVDEDALRFEGADIDAEIVVHWTKSSRSRLKPASIAAMRLDEQRGQLRRDRRGRRPRARNACSAWESRDRSRRRRCPTSCT